MEIIALCVSLLSLIVGSIAYYPSGGKNDIRVLERALNQK